MELYAAAVNVRTIQLAMTAGKELILQYRRVDGGGFTKGRNLATLRRSRALEI